jgi:hypothetical protein
LNIKELIVSALVSNAVSVPEQTVKGGKGYPKMYPLGMPANKSSRQLNLTVALL